MPSDANEKWSFVIARAVATLLLVALPTAGWGQEDAAVRVVPRLEWPATGVLSPDGKYGVTSQRNGLRVVDIEEQRLAFACDLSAWVTSVSFSPDGKMLAASGRRDGVLLDLATFRERRLESLAGSAVAFTPDGEQIVLGADVNRVPGGKQKLRVLDLTGKVVRQFELNMVVANKITCNGDTATVVGWGGSPFSRRGGSGYLVT